ncbi:hypothetical protein OIU84_028218 [Salix udensis]|uniref:Uncharacterized protein n=1 Tax=Salix udensis TaxID=889485 RepID=A0AAD6P999_9ROSI|nr:hypothetical protein OIU84_028218 [Salix udensis]
MFCLRISVDLSFYLISVFAHLDLEC